ncbi:MAG: discoidin domain-containing protein [Deltaproteobacteria bacterium]|nr:discoidin domain-containing protein [Deltaproteobacteria bacterium]MBW2019044.1 discoidin domain-containing protein [Deltaproteobacteria bacterium]MBW2073804.1 discoidin domain-containing protein [Deltaproteobacteria bacterium]
MNIESLTTESALFALPSICSRVCVLVVMVLILTLGSFRDAYARGDIRGSANLSYRSTEIKTAQGKKSSWSLNQLYNIGLSKAFTPKVNFTADLGINISETDDTKTTRLYPDMRLSLSNEYFNANAGYRLTEKGLDILTMVSDEERFTTESWNTNFSTKSEKYPRVRLRYNQDKSYDHLSVHETNTKTDRFAGRADYAYRFLNLYYQYTNKISDDYVVDKTQETNTHEGRMSFNKSFWRKKITSSGSYSINTSNTETTARGQDITVSDKKTASDGLYANNPAAPLNIQLDSRASLIDGNKSTSTGINIGANTNQNIGLDLTFSTEIEKIYLYTTTPDTFFNKNAYTWAVHYSSDNQNWTQLTPAASFDYNTNQERFEVSFTKTSARYFKMVNTATDGRDLDVTEIEAYGFKTQSAYTTTETQRTTQNIQANLGFRPLDWLSFTYNFSQDQQKTEEASDSTKTRQSSHNISGRAAKGFQLHKYLKVQPEYHRQQKYEYDSEAGTKHKSTDIYRIHLFSSPLKTLDTDLSLNHRVLKEDSETQTRTSSALLHIVAKLREGANLDIDGDMTRSENLVGETVSTSRSINSTLRLELTSALTTEIEYNINWSETEAPTGGTTGRRSDTQTTIYWRPSHELYFRGSYRIGRDEESGEETSQHSYQINWLMTKKVQLRMDYTIDRSGTIMTSYSSDLSWNLSQMMSLRFGYAWSRQEADTQTQTQTITTDFSARF